LKKVWIKDCAAYHDERKNVGDPIELKINWYSSLCVEVGPN
jgi:hypothetical protein